MARGINRRAHVTEPVDSMSFTFIFPSSHFLVAVDQGICEEYHRVAA